MTVIQGNNYSYPKPGSSAGSDTESLHLESVPASDTESLNNEPTETNRTRPLPIRVAQIGDVVRLKKSAGKKKLRRHQNRCVLQTLDEEDEENTVVVVMEPYHSPFARLLSDDKAMSYWNKFIEQSEEQQLDILREYSNRCSKPTEHDKQEKAYGRISSRIKRTIKIRKNLSMESIKDCEDDLLKFFRITPKNVYAKFPPTSFDRLLLHAIAQYHGLNSISVLCENGNRRSVEVYNEHEQWVPAECFLTDFIQKLRS